MRFNIPQELLRLDRGCRAGSKTKAKRRRYKPFILSIIMGNARSLGNNMDELKALIGTQRENQECSVIGFNETWLHEDIPDSSIPRFQTVRAGRDADLRGKRKGGRVALFLNNRWCNSGHVTVKECHCCPKVELLAVGHVMSYTLLSQDSKRGIFRCHFGGF